MSDPLCRWQPHSWTMGRAEARQPFSGCPAGTTSICSGRLASFGLDRDPALLRLGARVHALDVGGASVPETSGFEAIMAGTRARAVTVPASVAFIPNPSKSFIPRMKE